MVTTTATLATIRPQLAPALAWARRIVEHDGFRWELDGAPGSEVAHGLVAACVARGHRAVVVNGFRLRGVPAWTVRVTGRTGPVDYLITAAGILRARNTTLRTGIR